ncbi:hypothetical protein CYLTODRAFT_315315, partial [Cylindrobasidium torrendii FP15055 ss-10]
RLGLSYHNTAGMHDRLEDIPRRAGKWHVKHITYPDRPNEPFTICHQDIIESIQSLWGDPDLEQHIVYQPRRIFADAQKDRRIYNEMWSGKWWWQIQVRTSFSLCILLTNYLQKLLPKGCTVAPLIISTDKTQLTQFSGSKQAYPVYLTLGNIPSRLRRKPSQQACILLAYLPVEKVQRVSLGKKVVSAQYQQLFHTAMSTIFAPLKDAGLNGVELTSGSGAVCRVHPILAAYVADYPEQCLVTCSKQKTCPKCTAGLTDIGSSAEFPKRTPKGQKEIMDAARNTT